VTPDSQHVAINLDHIEQWGADWRLSYTAAGEDGPQ
jgi:hypothetical protein